MRRKFLDAGKSNGRDKGQQAMVGEKKNYKNHCISQRAELFSVGALTNPNRI